MSLACPGSERNPDPGRICSSRDGGVFHRDRAARLTGITLIIEMTGNYSQMLPLLVACFCAYAVSELMKDLPVYEVYRRT